MDSNCLSYGSLIDTLCWDECASYGVSVPCEAMQPLTLKKRRYIWGKYMSAQQHVQSILDAPLCPQQICNESHSLKSDCTIKLDNCPIAYLGKKVEVKIGTYEICYTTGNCGAIFSNKNDTCSHDGAVGYVLIPDEDIPEGVTLDQLGFKYPDYCRNPTIPLEQPCLDCTEYTNDTTVIQAVWPKCHLLDPNQPRGEFNGNCFLEEVIVCYTYIDEEQAISIKMECKCGCSYCSSNECAYSVEIGDAISGTVCVKPTGGCCGKCAKILRFNYGTAFDCGEDSVSEILKHVVSLVTVVKTGKILFTLCKNAPRGMEMLEYLLEQDPDSQGPLTTVKALPFGGTRAGMEASRSIDAIMVSRGRKKKNLPTGGALIAHGRA